MDQLRKEGWYINESQTAELFEEGVLPKTSQEIVKTILNEDLRHFGEASIINLHKKEESTFDGPCVLQLLRYRNVSVPRIKEELNQTDPTHSIIRLFLTDGHTSVSALVLQTIPGINSDTPPGTKIQINGTVQMEGNFLVLEKKNVKILGGRVEEMIEKWNVEKSSVRADGFKSSVGKGTGAPKWVSFGKRGQKGQLEKGFKANAVMPKTQKEGDDADDFAKNRAEILKELETENTAKTFAKPNLAPPPVKAPAPPKERKEPAARPPRKPRGRKNSEDGPDVDVGEYANHKPSGPATLFDFIGGGEPELVQAVTEKTAKMHVSSDRKGSFKGESRSFEPRQKFEHNKGGNFKKGPNDNRPSNRGETSGRNHGDREQRPPRNDARGPGGSGPKAFGNQQGSFPKPRGNQDRRDNENQGGPRRGGDNNAPGRSSNTGKAGFQNNQSRPSTQPAQFQQTNRQSQQNRPNTDRPNTGPSFDNRQNQGRPSTQPAQFQQTDRQSQQNRPNTGPSFENRQHQEQPRQQNFPQRNQQNPRGNFQRPPNQPNFQQQGGFQGNFEQRGPPPKGNQQNFQRGPPGAGNSRFSAPGQWQVGSQCLATWTDGNLYPATITELHPNRTAVVRYNEYGNVHTIPVDFLIYP